MTQTLLSTALFTAIGFTATALGTTALAETPCDATMMQGSIAQLSTTHATVQTSILIEAAPAEAHVAEQTPEPVRVAFSELY